MRAEYTITLADFKAAQHLCRRRSRRAWLLFLFWYRVAPVLGVVSATGFFYGLHHTESFPPWLGGVLAGCAWFGLFPLLWWPVQLRLQFRRMKEGAPDDAPVELELEGNELISRRPGLSEGRFRWAAIQSYAEDERIALVFVRKKLFLLIPKRALDDEGWSSMHRWLGSKAGRAPEGAPC